MDRAIRREAGVIPISLAIFPSETECLTNSSCHTGGDALIAFIVATAQSQAEATKESQKAGIEHAKAAQDGRYLGRKPSHSREQYQAVFDMLAQGAGISSIA